MIRYFREGLRPSIRAQLDARGRELDSWEEAIEKAIDAEAKASLQPPSILREMDQRCPRGNRLAYTTVAKFQASTRDPRNESSASSAWHPQDESPCSSHPHSLRSESGETSEKGFRKEKKKQRRLDHERARKDSTPAAGVYTPRQRCQHGSQRSESYHLFQL